METYVTEVAIEEKSPNSYDVASFTHMQDYKEGALKEKGDVLFGSRYHLRAYYNDIEKNGELSTFFGCVLYPERIGDWSYEKNVAFWAGAIVGHDEIGRKFKLITDIKNYPNKDNEVSGTVSEICWLQDAGYTFTPDPKDPMITIANPPAKPQTDVKLIDYRKVDPTIVLNRVKELSENVRTEREQKFGHSLARNRAYDSSKRDDRWRNDDRTREKPRQERSSNQRKDNFNNNLVSTGGMWKRSEKLVPRNQSTSVLNSKG